MLATAIIALLALPHPVVCQVNVFGTSTHGSGFHPDPLTTGNLTIFCLFTFAFFIQTAWCCIALVQGRGHRSPYAFLISALILSLIDHVMNILALIFEVSNSGYSQPPALHGVQIFFSSWTNLFLYLSMIAVLWSRETTVYAATEGKAGRHNYVVTGVHAVLVVLIFAFGTAGPAMELNPNDSSTINVYAMYYSFYTFLILAVVTVIVPAVLLRRASRAEGVVDNITNTMLHVVAPIYAAHNLISLIFLILHDLPHPPHALTYYEGADLANNLLIMVSYFGVTSALLVLSINKERWKVNGDIIPKTNMTTQHDWAQHVQSPQHWQPDDHTRIRAAANGQDNNVSNSGLRLRDEQVSLQHLTPMKLEIPNDLANRSSPMVPSFSQNTIMADNALPVVLAPNPLGPLAGPSGDASSEPTREPMRLATSAVANVPHLTDEQIDFVGRLSSVNVPITDIARLMESMRARGAAGGAESGSGEISGVDPGTAPPSYDNTWD